MQAAFPRVTATSVQLPVEEGKHIIIELSPSLIFEQAWLSSLRLFQKSLLELGLRPFDVGVHQLLPLVLSH